MTTAPIPNAPLPERPGPERPRSDRPQVDAGRLWPGGIATAVVAGLVALVGVLVCRWLFGIPLLAPEVRRAPTAMRTRPTWCCSRPPPHSWPPALCTC